MFAHVWRVAGLTVTLLIVPWLLPAMVDAQAQPPNRYFGSVKINGNDQPEGTVVEAYVGNTLCGSGFVQDRNGTIIYFVDVLGAGQKPNCAKDGDKVTFKVAGLDAKESGKYETAAATHLDLTASGSPRNVAQPTVLAPGTGGTPAPPPTFTPVPTQAPSETGTPPPEGAAETAAATPATFATPTATAAPTETPTATVAPSTSVGQPQARSAGPPAALVAFAIAAVVIIAAGAGLWLYQRRARP